MINLSTADSLYKIETESRSSLQDPPAKRAKLEAD